MLKLRMVQLKNYKIIIFEKPKIEDSVCKQVRRKTTIRVVIFCLI
jgi:hypothetical protein